MLGILIAIGSALFVASGLAWALWRRQRKDVLRETLRVLERKLARRGIVRRHGEGPRHYLTRAARALPEQRVTLAQLTTAYLELRYAHNEPPPEPLRELRRAVRDFHPARMGK